MPSTSWPSPSRRATELTGADSRAWLDRFELDHDNLRARASTGRLTHGEVEIALRLGAALWRFWQIRGHLEEARQRLDRIFCDAECGRLAAGAALARRGRGGIDCLLAR